MTHKNWHFKAARPDSENVRAAAQKYHIPALAAAVLMNRGIDGDEIVPFLKKSLSDIVNPFLMNDMDKAAERLIKAADSGEKITVYGDYDVDGITAAALLYDFLISIGANAEYYIPDRRSEGYGINIMAVNKLVKNGTKLMITVDCGITATGEVEFAKLQGMDVIITDHHTCKERLPSAEAVLNPKRPDSEYPFESLAGVGVAFKLILAAAVKKNLNTNEVFARYADLAALGTVADVVPLVGENRVITDKGLKLIENPRRVGIRALLEVSGAPQKPVNASTIAYTLAPRLNAAGRLASAATAVELLLTQDAEKARSLAQELDSENTERRETEREILDEALAMISSDPSFDKKKVIVLAHEDWHHGVIGIVASKLGEMFYKPCILISHSNGIGKGSGRSIKGFNLFDALTACEKYLTEFGGHAAAAGLNINVTDIPAFDKAINKYADETLTENDMIPSIEIDCPLSARSLTLENAKMLSKLEPFGMGNEKPVFALLGAEAVSCAAVGADGRHLRLRVRKDGQTVNCIGFGMGAYADKIKPDMPLDLAFMLDVNTYQGEEYVQLILRDIKFK